MSIVLYRKYRSQTFDELVGQEHITSILKNAVSRKQISHAYLFFGPRGLGKTSAARILAKAVNCLQLQPDGNPCGECANCLSIKDGKFLDMIEIDAASNRGIDQIRDLKEKIEFSPTEGRFKVYIIDEVHMLTSEAFNALLKTLEEPPAHAIFILCTTEIHKIPATILSRCQRFDFKLATQDDLKNLLQLVTKKEKIKVEDRALDLVIENAKGSYRDALSLLDVVFSGQAKSKDPKTITEEEVRVALGLADSTMAYFFLEKIVNGETAEALELVQELSSKGVNLSQFVKFSLTVLREILVGNLKGNVDYLEYSFAKKLDRKKALLLINLFIEAERSLKDAVIPTLPLEILVADTVSIFQTENDAKEVEEIVVKRPKKDKGGDDGNDGSNRKKTIGRVDKVAKTEAKEVKKESKTENVSNSKLTLTSEELSKKWPEVLRELRPFNSHLYAFIAKATVREIKDGILKLAVAFDFHKDRLESPKSRIAISEVFKKVFGCPVAIDCCVDNEIRGSIKAPSETVIINDVAAPAEKKLPVVKDTNKPRNLYDSVAEVFGEELVAA